MKNKLPSKTTGTGKWIRCFAAAATLFAVLSRFLPSPTPLHFVMPEESWVRALHWAFQQRAQFGSEIVFTYGPWGFLSCGYDPATYGVSVAAWSALALVFWWAGWRTARTLFRNEFTGALWLIALAAVAGFT